MYRFIYIMIFRIIVFDAIMLRTYSFRASLYAHPPVPGLPLNMDRSTKVTSPMTTTTPSSPNKTKGPLLLENYVPPVMQALAYYIELLQYEQVDMTTIEPPLNAEEVQMDTTYVPPSTSTLSSILTTTTTTQKPWWQPATTTQRPSTTTITWWKPPTTTITTTKKPSMTTTKKPSTIWWQSSFSTVTNSVTTATPPTTLWLQTTTTASTTATSTTKLPCTTNIATETTATEATATTTKTTTKKPYTIWWSSTLKPTQWWQKPTTTSKTTPWWQTTTNKPWWQTTKSTTKLPPATHPTVTNILQTTPFHRPGLFAPFPSHPSEPSEISSTIIHDNSIDYPSSTTTKSQKLSTTLKPQNYDETNFQSITFDKNFLEWLLKPKSKTLQPEIEYDFQLLDPLPASLIQDILSERYDLPAYLDSDNIKEFLRIYDDSFGRYRPLTGKKKIPITKPYVEFLLLYDLLKREAKAMGLNKYEGYAPKLLKELAETSKRSAERQLHTLMTRMLLRNDVKRNDVLNRVKSIIKDLENPDSIISKALRYLPPLKFLM